MKKLRNLNVSGAKKLALSLAKKYKNKDVVIGLVGPLGAGKTTFVKNFASFFGIRKIKSPTFIVGSRHHIRNRYLYHFDLYRLHSIKQLIPLDFRDTLSSSNRIILIEWADKFPSIAKECDRLITFGIAGKNLRNVTIR